jgi:hypothetical protein
MKAGELEAVPSAPYLLARVTLGSLAKCALAGRAIRRRDEPEEITRSRFGVVTCGARPSACATRW